MHYIFFKHSLVIFIRDLYSLLNLKHLTANACNIASLDG